MSATAKTEAALARIAAENAALHAFTAVTPEAARVDAAYVDRPEIAARGLPLRGEPVAIKDIVDVAGLQTRAGSKTRDHLPPAARDATLVAKLRAAGMIVVGKTHTVEYAFGGWGTNPVAGTPWNPADRKVHRTPGGSSSGSGVAVGADLVHFAIGTDTGGSVRLPAAWCGCVGYKTSTGLISRAGVVPLAEVFDTIGPMTRTVAQAAAMAQVMFGSDLADPATHGVAPLDVVTDLEAGVAGLTIGLVSTGDVAVDAAVAAAVEGAAKILEKAGARLVPVTLPETFATYANTCGAMMGSEAFAHYGRFIDGPGERLGAGVALRMRKAGEASATAVHEATARRPAMIAAAHKAIEACNLLLSPTTPAPAMRVAEVDEAGMPGVLTRFVNFLDWCGVSVPVGAADGLPVGAQIVARRFDDALALRAARVLEKGLVG